jgi:hypothetical protein
MARTKTKSGDLEKPYAPTEREADIIAASLEKIQSRVQGPKFKMDYDKDTKTNLVGFDHPDGETAFRLAMHETGTGDVRFFQGIIKQIAALGESGKPVSGEAADFVKSVVAAIEPKDEIESMFAAQMAAVHQATMMMAKRLNHVDNIPQQDSAERAFNKLARTFATQMETLKRYRAKAQQTVRVERVTVNDGGQ